MFLFVDRFYPVGWGQNTFHPTKNIFLVFLGVGCLAKKRP